MDTLSTNLINQNKIFAWIALGTGLILAIPFIAMQLTTEVDWKLLDFTLAGSLIFTMASLCVLLIRRVNRTSDRIIIGLACLGITLYLWAEMAVGIFTSWGS